MSTATVRKVDSSGKQPPEKSAGDYSEIESIARPPAKFGVQSVRSDVNLPDAVVPAREPNSEHLMNAPEITIQLGASERIVRDDAIRHSPPRRAVTSSTAQFAEFHPDSGAGQTPNLLKGEFVTPQQLAAELGISVRTLYRWHCARQGPPRVVLGRVIFYRRSSVLQWIEQREERLTRRARR